VAGPCTWTNVDTSCCQDFWATLTVAEQNTALAAATFVIWAATGRQFGLCDVTVRPCGMGQCDDGIGGWFWNNGVWEPYVLGGLWFNCSCLGPCSCGARCKVYLPGPVASVTSVLLDGVVVDPATWRVDDGRWLVRTGTGNCWPTSQNFDVDSGTGTLIVNYSRGTAVPSYLLSAAGKYACEWAKACRGTDCELPSRIVTLTRQDVTFENTNIDLLLQRGFTGIQFVDQLIALANPSGLTHRMRVLSPDLPGPVMTTSP
jgi:hypothetical protein